MDGVLRERASSLVGILNGVDYEAWNPDTDRFIARNYNRNSLSGKKACKADLQRSFGLREDANVPVIGMVSRLAAQKGLDLLEEAFDDLMSRGIQFVLLGTGERHYEKFLGEAAARYGGRVGVRIAYDEALAHKVIAGADMLLMPSFYEPSGLTQICGLRYGTIPVVRATGGLRDTVDEADPKIGKGTGFLFRQYTSRALLEAVDRALVPFHRQDKWTTVMRNAMAADFSWNRSAQAYLELYRGLARPAASDI